MSCPYRSFSSDPFTHLEEKIFHLLLTVSNILVECNNVAEKRKEAYIFGKRDVVESFRVHPLILLYFKMSFFILNFNLYNCDKQFTQLFTLLSLPYEF